LLARIEHVNSLEKNKLQKADVAGLPISFIYPKAKLDFEYFYAMIFPQVNIVLNKFL
jgi:hypothetical protein